MTMAAADQIAGRSYMRVYSVSGRRDLHDFLIAALESSGSKVIYASDPSRAPFFYAVQTDLDERLGLLIYPFRANKRDTRNRPTDEIRGQIRLGGEESWEEGSHDVALDVSGVDTTLVLAADPEAGVIIGLDPHLWSPLPMGISIYVKQSQIEEMGEVGWHVWEKDNRVGRRRTKRSDSGNETYVVFTPNRLLDYARFERRATDLGLDTPLRYSLAESFGIPAVAANAAIAPHVLEEEFLLTSQEILSIISDRTRLQVAVRGGVAEHHLEKLLMADPFIASVERLDVDAQHDFNVVTIHGDRLAIECKNASPERYSNGDFRVEVQKTRASQNDPASRFYPVTNFDVVAACMYSPTRAWTFRFRRTADLERHKTFPDRLAPLHRIDELWPSSLRDL